MSFIIASVIIQVCLTISSFVISSNSLMLNENFPVIIVNPDTIKAQIEIEIESEGSKRLAKLFDKVKLNDKLQVYIKPQKDCAVWVLVENEEGLELVSSAIVLENNVNIMPDHKSKYMVDGKSKYEKFIFIFALGKDSRLINPSINTAKLKKIIADVKRKSEVVIAEEGDPLIDISGNVRDPYQMSRKMYKGLNYLIIEFRFDVKK